jgi:putative nucleotidyltransferase with HDIG domain
LINRLIKRTRQFFRAVFSTMEDTDHAFVQQILSNTEKQLFYSMNNAVQKHCVNVARIAQDLLKDRPEINHNLVLRVALLHDLGKSADNIALMDRVLYVLACKLTPSLVYKLAKPGVSGICANLRNSFFVHVNHEEFGATIAQKACLDDNFIYLVRNHHNQTEAAISPELAVLLKADELN